MAYDKYSVQHQILCSLMIDLYGGHRFLGMRIHYSTRNPLSSYKVCLCFLLLYKSRHCAVWLFIFVEIKFSWISLGFLVHDNLSSFIYMMPKV